jgi:hypothetical protein
MRISPRAHSQACPSMILWHAPMYLVAERHPLDQVGCRVNDSSRASRVIATASALDRERHRTLRC